MVEKRVLQFNGNPYLQFTYYGLNLRVTVSLKSKKVLFRGHLNFWVFLTLSQKLKRSEEKRKKKKRTYVPLKS